MKNRLHPVVHFMEMSQDNVLDKFFTIKNAYSDGTVEDQTRFIFIPGTRPDKALLVSHADHVFGSERIKVDCAEGILFSNNERRTAKIEKKHENFTSTSWGVGIAADDRVGNFICWKLRNSGHSILITSGEEKSCNGIKWILNSDYWKDILNDHVFAIEFDRMNSRDCVFYDVGTNKFVEYVKGKTGFKPESGFGSDIKYCCKSICGTNLSVGYYGQHTTNERVVIDQMENTLAIAREWLSGPLEKFPLDPSDKFTYTYPTKNYSSQTYSNLPSHYRDEYEDSYGYEPSEPKREPLGPINSNWVPYQATEKGLVRQDQAELQRIVCTNEKCKEKINVEDWFENKMRCPKCNILLV